MTSRAPRAARISKATFAIFIATSTLSIGVGFIVTAVAPTAHLDLLIGIAGALAVAPFVVGLLTRRFDVFEPAYIFGFSFGLLFFVRPLVDLTHATNMSWIGYDISRTYGRAMLVADIGAAAFYAAYYSSIGRGWGRRWRVPSDDWSLDSLTALAIVIGTISVALLASFARSAGGLGPLLSGRSAAYTTAVHGSSGYVYTAPLWIFSIGVLILALAHRWRSSAGRIGFACVAFSQIIEIGAGDRSWFVPAMAAVVLLRYLRQRRRPSAAAMIIFVFLTFVFGISVPEQLRSGQAQSLSAAVSTAVHSPGSAASSFFSGADTAMAPDLAIEMQWVPSALPYRHGVTYLEAVARPFPHAFWPSKPQAADSQLTGAIWPQVAASGGGFSFSFFGEPYFNGGVIGVVIAAFAFGLFWRALYWWFAGSSSNRTVMAIYAVSWPFMFVYMRGGVGVDYQRQVIAVFPVLLAVVVASRSRRDSRRAQAVGLEV